MRDRLNTIRSALHNEDVVNMPKVMIESKNIISIISTYFWQIIAIYTKLRARKVGSLAANEIMLFNVESIQDNSKRWHLNLFYINLQQNHFYLRYQRVNITTLMHVQAIRVETYLRINFRQPRLFVTTE